MQSCLLLCLQMERYLQQYCKQTSVHCVLYVCVTVFQLSGIYNCKYTVHEQSNICQVRFTVVRDALCILKNTAWVSLVQLTSEKIKQWTWTNQQHQGWKIIDKTLKALLSLLYCLMWLPLWSKTNVWSLLLQPSREIHSFKQHCLTLLQDVNYENVSLLSPCLSTLSTTAIFHLHRHSELETLRHKANVNWWKLSLLLDETGRILTREHHLENSIVINLLVFFFNFTIVLFWKSLESWQVEAASLRGTEVTVD